MNKVGRPERYSKEMVMGFQAGAVKSNVDFKNFVVKTLMSHKSNEFLPSHQDKKTAIKMYQALYTAGVRHEVIEQKHYAKKEKKIVIVE